MSIPYSNITLLSRKNIIRLAEEHGFKDIVSYLFFIQKNPILLVKLLNAHSFAVPDINKKILFHGSQNIYSVLEPFATLDVGEGEKEERLVYATSDPNYAIFLAILDLKSKGSAFVVVTEEVANLSIDAGFINGESQLQERGYLHIIDATQFTETGNSEFVSDCPVNVLGVIEVFLSDITVPITIKSSKK